MLDMVLREHISLLGSSVGKGKILLAKLPFNRAANYDVDAMVHALKDGYDPAA
jgi:hypothetical protein